VDSLASVADDRVFRRASVRCALRFEVDDRAVEGELANISEGGVAALVSQPLAPGVRVDVRWAFEPSQSPMLCASGSVQWQRGCPGARWMVGVEFVDLAEDVAAAIRAVVDRVEPMAWDDPSSASGVLPNELARRFVPVIRKMAHAMVRGGLGVARDDLIGAGFVGLVEAYRSYRSEAGVPFEQWASLRIRGAMRDEARAIDPLTRGQRSLQRRSWFAFRSLVQRLQREPTLDELAAEIGVAVEELDRSRALIHAALRQANIEDFEALVADGAPSPDEHLLRRERLALLQMGLEGLPPRLREVLTMYYGESMTLRSIASVLGVTEARVSQLHSEAVQRLCRHCQRAEQYESSEAIRTRVL
jgi:RNA polymerase sigma factor for flagellar operon FliA